MTSLLEKYKEFLPPHLEAGYDLLGEGATPLVQSRRISPSGPLFFKMEQVNPTGSFKDRFAAVQTALIKSAGIDAFIATSSGNTGAALSAYAARHGLSCLLFVNEIVPDNKLTQMLAYGAQVFRVKDFGLTKELSAPIFKRLQHLAEEENIPLVISAYKYCPEGMEGVKTIAYEIVEQLDVVPGHVFVPVGGGGLLTGIWRGFDDLRRRGILGTIPRIHAVQPELNDTLVTPLNLGQSVGREVGTTTTISGLAVQVDIDASAALQCVKESGGSGHLVTDEDILRAQKILSEKEGVYVEPAGAASVAGYMKALSTGSLDAEETAVCILTGHGLKGGADLDASTRRPVDISGGEITRDILCTL
ncbi:MAG: pyridoxal-phosphate dependent enzyme [Pyrinomonadaceae bacterium]